MFEYIIITAPNQYIATVYQNELDRLTYKLRILQEAKDIICVADPQGKRVGSGGGTLNALDCAISKWTRSNLAASKLLIIHSGGDSRRAPFHSVCGKAWASLNASIGTTNTLATPIILLIQELSSLAFSIPKGSMTIASCDVLLDISPKSFTDKNLIYIPEDAVTIIGVPESPFLAQNHVYEFKLNPCVYYYYYYYYYY